MENLLAAILPMLLKLAASNPQIKEILDRLQRAAADLFPTVPDPNQADAGAAIANKRATMWWQTVLNLYGVSPPLNVDGRYGAMTKNAVTAFQHDRQLTVDGWVGDETDAAMRAWLTETFRAGQQPPPTA